MLRHTYVCAGHDEGNNSRDVKRLWTICRAGSTCIEQRTRSGIDALDPLAHGPREAQQLVGRFPFGAQRSQESCDLRSGPLSVQDREHRFPSIGGGEILPGGNPVQEGQQHGGLRTVSLAWPDGIEDFMDALLDKSDQAGDKFKQEEQIATVRYCRWK